MAICHLARQIAYAWGLRVRATEPTIDEEVASRPELLAQSVLGIVQRLSMEAERRVSLRQPIERRWLDDLRQYHGVHDDELLKRLKDTGKSALFINMTRPKTNAMEARIADLLFPTDDRNWGIKPTPVPELAARAKRAAEDAIRARQMADQAMEEGAADAGTLSTTADELEVIAERYRIQTEAARRRADLMGDEMEDQLVECNYNAGMRDVIGDGCLIGTGVAKGPIVNGQPKRRWEIAPDGSAALVNVPDPAPRFARTDPWHFFPDPDARCVADSEDFFERHLYKPKDLRKLARLPGFRQDEIRELLREGAQESAPQFLTDIRSITTDRQDMSGDFYVVWEYHGTLTADELGMVAEAMDDPGLLDDAQSGIDPLDEIHVCIWFCRNRLLSIAPHPMDSGEPIYSVFNLEKDPTSIFGFGVPYMLRDSQRALNGAWRMMMDNSGLSVGPQIEVNRDQIEPQDGDWSIRPNKVWFRKQGGPQDMQYPAIRTYNIESHQAELAGIIEIALKFIDDESAMPMIAQGEQGARPTPTLGGMSILMNSANVVFRRVVKNFDDDITVPNIRRLYDWNMQHNQKEEIKGDYEIDARGSSVLLVREMMATNLMLIAQAFGTHPVYGVMLRHPEIMRRIVQAHMIPADDIVLSNTEIDRIVAANSKETPPPEIALREMEIDSKVQIANLEANSRMQVAELQFRAAMTALAEKMNMTIEELSNRLTIAREKMKSDERKLAVETAMTQQIGPTGGGVL